MANIVPKNVLEMLKRAALGGLNKDCIIMSTPEGSAVMTLDESQSVFCHANCNESFGEHILGIGRIDILMKYLAGVPSESIMATVQDNRVVFTDSNTNFRYLLSDPANIRCQLEEEYVPKNGEDYAQTFEECPFSIALTDEDRTYFKKMMGITCPRTVTVKMSKSGRVTIAGGGDNEHNFDRVIGAAKITEDSGATFAPVEIKLYGDIIKRVFEELTVGVMTTMYIATDGSAIAFIQDGVLYNIKPITE